MSSKLVFLIAFLLVALLGLASVACDSNNDEDIMALNSRVDQIQQTLTKAQVAATLSTLSAVGFHDVNTELQAATQIPAEDPGKIRKAQQLTAAVAWPVELKDKGVVLLTSLKAFRAALEANDLSASKKASSETHDAWHDLEHSAYMYVGGETGAMEEPDTTTGATASPAAH